MCLWFGMTRTQKPFFFFCCSHSEECCGLCSIYSLKAKLSCENWWVLTAGCECVSALQMTKQVESEAWIWENRSGRGSLLFLHTSVMFTLISSPCYSSICRRTFAPPLPAAEWTNQSGQPNQGTLWHTIHTQTVHSGENFVGSRERKEKGFMRNGKDVRKNKRLVGGGWIWLGLCSTEHSVTPPFILQQLCWELWDKHGMTPAWGGTSGWRKGKQKGRMRAALPESVILHLLLLPEMHSRHGDNEGEGREGGDRLSGRNRWMHSR